ncbi:Basic helix-loop-helix DNA-binding superfamily protein, putative isoform 2 [Hibiscus syriacus]|uniref:Basic helix-loop-helix DNA-binding superfamily protein, putative isoform 2 n=1 Tax=Hibiscus syriacus TaxID=106335 RepID=A0A6A2YXT0_HIBSY|nr:Basic helix-loop-helix DNA-binding superfamily protein, putative isoform 2 [Hibiscus syriacus]
MEPNARTMETRYNLTALNGDEVTMFKSLQFTDEIHRLISTPPTDNASSFTALLELPSPQAVELLYSPESSNLIPTSPLNFEDFKDNFHFPSNTCLIERDTRFSAEVNNNNESEKSKSPESKNLSTNLEKAIKSEQAETESSQPLASDPTLDKQNIKRNDGENKVKGSTKKNKTAVNESSENAQKLPYVHKCLRYTNLSSPLGNDKDPNEVRNWVPIVPDSVLSRDMVVQNPLEFIVIWIFGKHLKKTEDLGIVETYDTVEKCPLLLSSSNY